MPSTQTASRSRSSTHVVLKGLSTRILAGLRGGFAAYKAHSKQRQHSRHLARLDDYLLRDIGLERENVVESPPFVTGYEGLEIERRRR